MKKTLKEIIIFKSFAQDKRFGAPENNKFAYALYKCIHKLPVDEKEILKKLQIQNCMCDEKTGAILRDANGQYMFTKDGELKLESDWKKELDVEYEIEPYLATFLPPDLNDIEKDVFNNFVLIKEMDSCFMEIK